MKKLILTSLLASAVLVNMSAQWSGTNPLSTSNRVAITKGGVGPDNAYNGSLSITQPPASGQYINLTRAGVFPWSIGTAYNTSVFAIGQGTANDAAFTNPFFTISTTGEVGIGILRPLAKLHVESGDNKTYASILATTTAEANKLVVSSGNTTGANTEVFRISHEFPGYGDGGRNNGFISFKRGGSYNDGVVEFGTKGTTRMRISSNGNVGIGLPAGKEADAALTVKGTIHATQVRIDLSGALADYVFDKNYKLMDLKDVENYVNEHSHLPEVPSASEVATNGMDLGEMQNKMLQKIEELTLYVIKQQKEIEALKATSGK